MGVIYLFIFNYGMIWFNEIKANKIEKINNVNVKILKMILIKNFKHSRFSSVLQLPYNLKKNIEKKSKCPFRLF